MENEEAGSLPGAVRAEAGLSDNSPAPAQRPVADRVLAGWLWRRFVRPNMGWMLAAMLLAAIEGASAGALSLIFRPLLDEVMVNRQGDMLVWGAAALAGIFLVRAATRLGAAAITANVAEKVAAKVQTDLLRHMLRLDLSFFQRHAPGSLIERVRGDGEAMAVLFQFVLPTLARDLIAVIVLLGVAFWTDWVWTLIVLASAPLFVLPVALMQRIVRRMTRRERVAATETSRRLDEIFHGIVTIRLTGAEARETAHFRENLGTFVSARIRSLISQQAIPSLVDLIAAGAIFVVLIYGGSQIIAGERTLGQLVSFLVALGLLFDPIRNLGEVGGKWQAVLASIERIWQVLDMKPGVTSPTQPAPAPAHDKPCRIELDQVSFSYGDLPALRGVSMTIEPGERVALVGPSGAGKSTLFQLLTRLDDPGAGRVLIDGQDIRTLDLAELRQLFSVVTQETALFDMSLRENVLMSRPEAGSAELQAAYDAAHVSEFLGDLTEGDLSRVGPRGSALSGGQRQRVGIARAVLRDAPILLLDEPTSALDTGSEALVSAALAALGRGRTTLMITHRLASAREADRIIVLDRGRVVETGTHAQLAASGGLYAQLLEGARDLD